MNVTYLLHELFYDKNDFMANHVLSEYYKYCQGHTCKECEKRKENSY